MAAARREPCRYVTQVVAGAVDRTIAALAVDQDGVVSLAQLVALGLSSAAVRKRVERGRLHPVHRGVYAVGHPRLTARGRWRAALLAIGDPSFLSHATAAALHDLVPVGSGAVHVAIRTPGGRVSRPGIHLHRLAALREDEVTVVGRFPVTSVARTIADLARGQPRARTLRLLERAEQLRVLDVAALPSGLQALVPAIAPPARSELERRVLALCRAHGLPHPQHGPAIVLPDGSTAMPDFVWPRERVILEADGMGTHGTRFAAVRDRRRDQLLAQASYAVIRTTWDQVTRRPHELATSLRALLATRR